MQISPPRLGISSTFNQKKIVPEFVYLNGLNNKLNNPVHFGASGDYFTDSPDRSVQNMLDDLKDIILNENKRNCNERATDILAALSSKDEQTRGKFLGSKILDEDNNEYSILDIYLCFDKKITEKLFYLVDNIKSKDAKKGFFSQPILLKEPVSECPSDKRKLIIKFAQEAARIVPDDVAAWVADPSWQEVGGYDKVIDGVLKNGNLSSNEKSQLIRDNKKALPDWERRLENIGNTEATKASARLKSVDNPARKLIDNFIDAAKDPSTTSAKDSPAKSAKDASKAAANVIQELATSTPDVQKAFLECEFPPSNKWGLGFRSAFDFCLDGFGIDLTKKLLDTVEGIKSNEIKEEFYNNATDCLLDPADKFSDKKQELILRVYEGAVNIVPKEASTWKIGPGWEDAKPAQGHSSYIESVTKLLSNESGKLTREDVLKVISYNEKKQGIWKLIKTGKDVIHQPADWRKYVNDNPKLYPSKHPNIQAVKTSGRSIVDLFNKNNEFHRAGYDRMVQDGLGIVSSTANEMGEAIDGTGNFLGGVHDTGRVATENAYRKGKGQFKKFCNRFRNGSIKLRSELGLIREEKPKTSPFPGTGDAPEGKMFR